MYQKFFDLWKIKVCFYVKKVLLAAEKRLKRSIAVVVKYIPGIIKKHFYFVLAKLELNNQT